MSHILAKIRGAQLSEIEDNLKKDFLKHAAKGLFLEHLWTNQERNDEILFLFRTIDLERARQFMDETKNRNGKDVLLTTPEFTFLEGK